MKRLVRHARKLRSKNPRLAAALEYAARGWPVFPVSPNAKKPLGTLVKRGLNDATTDPAKIRTWWTLSSDANIGINCGAAGLAVVDLDVKDIDGIENWKSWCTEHGIDPFDTLRAKTPSGGVHNYYTGKCSSKNAKNTKQPPIAAGIDVKSVGGYVLAPPSSVGGKEYAWESIETVEIQPLPSVIAEALAVRKKEFLKPCATPPDGALPLLELMLQDGLQLIQKGKLEEYCGPCPFCQDGEDRFTVWPDGGRDGLGRYWCRQCEEVGDSAEWLIRRRGMGIVAAKLSRGIPVPEKYLPKETTASQRTQSPATSQGDTNALGQQDLQTMTDEELERKEIRALVWVIPGFVPEGLSILVGNPKVGKSALVLGWAYDLASGLPVMGSIMTEKCEALYLALEDNDRRVQDRIRALRGGNPPASGLRYLTINSKPPLLRLDDGGAEQIERHLDKHPDCRLVIIDTWVKIKPIKRGGKSQSEYDIDSAAWAILHRIATERRIAIVVLHHTRKPLKFEGDWTQEISGTTGIAGTVDTIMLFKRQRGEKTATLKVTGRDHDEEKDYVLRGDPATKRWTLTSELPEQQLPKGHMVAILKVLQAQGPLWPRELQAACPHIPNVRAYLQRMLSRGMVIRGDKDKYSKDPSYSSDAVTDSDTVTAVTATAVAAPAPSHRHRRNSKRRKF